MTVYRDERGLSPILSKLLAVSFFASFFGCLSGSHFFPKWLSKTSLRDSKTFQNGSQKPLLESFKAYSQFGTHFLILFVYFLIWVCAANIVNTISKPHFSLTHFVYESMKNTVQKHPQIVRKFTAKSIQNRIHTGIQEKPLQKWSNLRKSVNNESKLGPKKTSIHLLFFAFAYWDGSGSPMRSQGAPKAQF